jgi:predicted nucleotidyltransferase
LSSDITNRLDDLPSEVRSTLADFVASALAVSGDNLKSVVLFGSGAEGQLRPTSDVNLILVFGSVRLPELQQLRTHLSFAHTVIKLEVMFLEEAEISLAGQAFAVKFTDVLARHRILHGSDVFAGLKIDRQATLGRLRQVLLNLTLRLRERYALIGVREEQMSFLVADVSGPVRACAAAILGLEGEHAGSPKEALQILAQRLPGNDWTPLLAQITDARHERGLPPATADSTMSSLLELLKAMYLHISHWS